MRTKSKYMRPKSILRSYETKGNTLAVSITTLTNLIPDKNQLEIQDTSSTAVSVARNQGYKAKLSNKISKANRNLWHIPISVVKLYGWKPKQKAVVVLTEEGILWTKPAKLVYDDMDYQLTAQNLKEGLSRRPAKKVIIRESKKN